MLNDPPRPPAPAPDRYPFLNHRTVAEVWRDGAAATARREMRRLFTAPETETR